MWDKPKPMTLGRAIEVMKLLQPYYSILSEKLTEQTGSLRGTVVINTLLKTFQDDKNEIDIMRMLAYFYDADVKEVVAYLKDKPGISMASLLAAALAVNPLNGLMEYGNLLFGDNVDDHPTGK